MKARIEKKLSKRLVEVAPLVFKDAWQEEHCEPTQLAYKQGSRVSGLWCVGGGMDYWGEGLDAYSVWEYWSSNFMWQCNFPRYPEGHRFEHYPDTRGFRATAKSLLNLARTENKLRQGGGV
jgi:hypothetical protein